MRSCKNCEQEIEADSATCPHCGAEQVDRSTESADLPAPLGARIAGGVLIANAILVLIESVMDIEKVAPINPIGAAVMDVVLGIALVRGSRRVVIWVIVRVILGVLLFSGLAIASSDWVSFWIQIVLSSGVLLLLVGNASRPRIIAAAALLSLYMVAAAAGLQQVATGRSFLTPLYAKGLYDLGPVEPGRLHGSIVAYTIEPPVDGWQLRSPEAARRDNPAVDHWLVNPTTDAHIIVIAESVDPATELSVEALADAVVSNFETAIEDFSLDDRAARPILGRQAEVLELSGTVETFSIRYRVACVASGTTAIQIICFAGPAVFPSVEQDFDNVIDSLFIGPWESSS
jgi:hypothetical protein